MHEVCRPRARRNSWRGEKVTMEMREGKRKM